MRRNARSWGIKVALGIICLVFIFFMGGGGRIGGNNSAMVTIGDSEITLTDYQRARSRNESLYRQQYGENLTPELRKILDIPGRTLSQLVNSAVLREEAKRLGLRVPDESLRATIEEVGAFQRDGRFSPALYRAALRSQSLSPSSFEASMREDMLVQQLLAVIRLGSHVSEDEAFRAYRRANAKMVLAFLRVRGAGLESEVSVSDEALENYYSDHREEYRTPERVRVRYMAYDPEHFTHVADVTDEDIEEYYQLNIEDEFTRPERVGARHILKKVAADAGKEAKAAARKAIEQIKQRLDAGEDFEALARESSDDVTASKGGDLGMFTRAKMVKPFEDAAFSLAEGQTSDIVETPFGYHIIQVYKHEAVATVPIEEVREEIKKKVALRAAGERAFDTAADDSARLRDGEPFEAIAKEHGLEIGETGFLTKGSTVAGIDSPAPFVAAALGLGKLGATSEPVHIGKTYYLLKLAEREDSRIPDLKEVRTEVEEAYRKEQGAELARARASKLLEELKNGKQPEDLADGKVVEAGETRPFTRGGDFVPGVGSIAGLKEVAFRTKTDGELLPRVFVQRGDAYVLRRKSYERAERKDFEEEKQALMERLRKQKQDAAVDEFVRGLKEKTKVAYNKRLLDQVLPR